MSQEELVQCLEAMKKKLADRQAFLASGLIDDFYNEAYDEFTKAMAELSEAMKASLPEWALMWEPVRGNVVIAYHVNNPLDYVTVEVGTLLRIRSEGLVCFQGMDRLNLIVSRDPGTSPGSSVMKCLTTALELALPKLINEAPKG